MSTRAVPLVARREVVERLRAKSFFISTGVYLAVALALVVIPQIAGDDKKVYGLGVAGPSATTIERSAGLLAPTLDIDVRTQVYPDAEAATAAVRSGEVTVAVVDSSRVLARDDLPDRLAALVNASVGQAKLVDLLADAGVTQAEAAAVLNPEPLPVDQLAPPKDLRESNRPLAFAGVLVIYLLLLTYGFTIANGVLEEKSSRVSEVLLGTLRPTQLLAGKVVGIGIVAIVQLLVIALPTIAVALAFGELNLPSGTPMTIGAVFAWGLLGYALYSCVFAAAGAAASRPEDIGNATAPITIMIALTYFVAVAATQEPDGTLARVVSFIPFMAPMTMLPRAAVGNVAAWEVPVSLALVVLTTYATVRLGARIYVGGLRRPGPRLKLREAWRAAQT
ncbi:MAG: ABC transporter permease [Acidimicrobiales bacterium]